ncbi:hypothetical protein PSM36_1594 [Proteiniphilum saccharofermentans]|uniref:Uncharacterized protein n=1 Tax=Proteiniphilum saccharofermentans TaxID=1642647 RepID=A0A1R3T9Z2_9BACT|nr:hypothetical protein [Proteiniphilum saccharofermentans]SCD20414.1 hypothetical protein PSM36_1594 [Proteiniphilum saccharofermentans]SEA38049.1 hypothetical protein SAMN05216331_1406 [Porphyromonadaceae bacterium KH3R12]
MYGQNRIKTQYYQQGLHGIRSLMQALSSIMKPFTNIVFKQVYQPF